MIWDQNLVFRYLCPYEDQKERKLPNFFMQFWARNVGFLRCSISEKKDHGRNLIATRSHSCFSAFSECLRLTKWYPGTPIDGRRPTLRAFF